MEYIYVLKNKSYAPYVVKIGLTTLTPEVRAKQLYWGSTGVPEHFDVAFVCGVPDCKLAEKEVHESLSVYRKNEKREFFCLPIDVAKQVVFKICNELFGEDDVVVYVNEDFRDSVDSVGDDIEVRSISMPIDAMSESPIGTSTLTDEQKFRASVIFEVFKEVFPISNEKWDEDFSRDHNPENEIVIWESMAKAFMKVSANEFATDEFKKEAYYLLLMRTMKSKSNVLKNRRKGIIDDKTAKKILSAYNLKPKPILVSYVK